MARVFVYGTLKTGQPNYFRMEKALKAGVVKFVGKARTVDLFPLIIAGRFNIPYLLWAKGKGNVSLSCFCIVFSKAVVLLSFEIVYYIFRIQTLNWP